MNHRMTMVALAQAYGWKRGIEIGLGQGRLFEQFLALGIEMVGVDLGSRKDRLAQLNRLVEKHPGKARLLIESSTTAHRHIADGWADFVFIDAGHSYEAARSDIANWRSKVRPGGWLGGHDYHEAFPGVIRAVDEAFPDAVKLDGWVWCTKESNDVPH